MEIVMGSGWLRLETVFFGIYRKWKIDDDDLHWRGSSCTKGRNDFKTDALWLEMTKKPTRQALSLFASSFARTAQSFTSSALLARSPTIIRWHARSLKWKFGVCLRNDCFNPQCATAAAPPPPPPSPHRYSDRYSHKKRREKYEKRGLGRGRSVNFMYV